MCRVQTRFRPPPGIFQKRPDQKAVVVNQRVLELCRKYASIIVKKNREKLQKHFSLYAQRTYGCPPSQVSFKDKERDEILRRVTHCIMKNSKGCINSAETTLDYMLINSRYKLTTDEIVWLMIHEYLHCYCVVRGRQMSTAREHECMRELGDDEYT